MNDISLRDYFDSQIKDVKSSIGVAYASMEKRLEGMNEFRDTLRDQASKFITREEYEAKHRQLDDKISTVQKIVWVGIGITLALQFLLRFFVK